MPALCSMLLPAYYALNYAGIIGRGLYLSTQVLHITGKYIHISWYLNWLYGDLNPQK